MRHHLSINMFLAVVSIITLMTGCTGRVETKQVQQPQERLRGGEHSSGITTYTQQAVMGVYDYDPVRALQIVDSAVIVGNLSPVRGDLMRAIVYSKTLAGTQLDSFLQKKVEGSLPFREGARFDSARAIGERLLVHDSIRADLPLQQDVLEILVGAARQHKDTLLWLQRSQQLVEVCHRQGDVAEPEALRTEAEVGAAICRMGQRNQGMARLDSVLAIFESHEHRQFNWLDAYIVTSKRKLKAMSDMGRDLEALPLALRVIERLDDYEQHPKDYHDGTYHEPKDDTERGDYIRFYRSQIQTFITAVHASLDHQGSMEDTYQQIERSILDATAREHLTRYRALEQQMAAERQQLETEAQAQRNLYFAVIVCILLAVALAALAWYFRQTRIIKQKNRALVQQIDEALRYKELYEEAKAHPSSPQGRDVELPDSSENSIASAYPTPPSSEGLGEASLFAQIHDTIIHEGLYLNPNCDRQMLTDRFGLTKERLGSLFVQYSDAKNVAAFINGLRLAHAAHLLTTQPDLDIREVAAASGFGSHQYFSTCFKQRFGLSPTDYRAAKGL